ncbi:PREDICTED: uncharacterized protein LOC108610049 [Drosophila arizonae]|uniref:Uncharacterized protein LOC108610049 n=1 Tax=Drosophila arizonae TaxID=7263 RepID=A0ABM1NQX9_DROAR|nr:PREDICTED: uncharacterized protein LOC108610049 [Drosophila arizonae]
MSKRKADSAEGGDEMTSTAAKTNATDQENIFVIGTAEPLKDYIRLIETKVTVDQIVDDAVTKENFKRIASAARDVIWKLLFSDECGDAESQKKASELLEEHKSDASFYAPWPYNEWIVKVRDELLKRELLDFWRDTIVAKQLGPCWSRDSDLFDSEDEPPLEFYAHAGCVAPFAASLKARAAEKAAASGDEDGSHEVERDSNNASALAGDFEARIGAEEPLSDYRDLMKRYVLTTVIVPDEVHKKNVEKIGQAARTAIWQLLFEGTPTASEFEKAAELLQEYKSDAGFYGPWEYNEWIVKLRDELLERKMLSFWGDTIVKLELGPCCSRDSDFFDADDALPAEFYNKAGFKAPFDSP